ncbi:TPA: transposase [Streptococcus suis]
MTLALCQACSFGLINSFPCALCQPNHNLSASLLSEVADISYNATKKVHYYGTKFSVLINDRGFHIDCVVIPASISDGMVAFELLENSPFSVIYGDKGYVDKQAKSHLSQSGIQPISQLRKNMVDYAWFDNYRHSVLGQRRHCLTILLCLKAVIMDLV